MISVPPMIGKKRERERENSNLFIPLTFYRVTINSMKVNNNKDCLWNIQTVQRNNNEKINKTNFTSSRSDTWYIEYK